jgi:hypothetical protein
MSFGGASVFGRAGGTDEFRDRWIVQEDPEARKAGFGDDTHFGHEFIYHTPTGRTFVFSLPYPDDDKGGDFHRTKADVAR